MQKKHFPDLPERISRLADLAYNLEWSWDNRSRLLFKRLDPDLWRATSHNPVKLLNEIGAERMKNAAEDPDFLRDYEATIKQIFRNGNSPRWFQRQFRSLRERLSPTFQLNLEFILPCRSTPVVLAFLPAITARSQLTWESLSSAQVLLTL